MTVNQRESTQRDCETAASRSLLDVSLEPAAATKERIPDSAASLPKRNKSRRAAAIVLYLFLLLPWCLVSLGLLLLAAIELLVRSCISPESNSFRPRDLLFVKAITDCKQCVRKIVKDIVGLDPSACVTDVLFPSISSDQVAAREKYHNSSKPKIKEIEDEILVCKELIAESCKSRRLIKQTTLNGESCLRAYCAAIGESRQLHDHLRLLQNDMKQLKALAQTQATWDSTGFHGLSDWAEKVTHDHQELMTALCQISLVGAGLTYTTVFSASRGDMASMCYAWALFNCGFIIPMASLSLLSWASRRSRTTLFASPKIWSLLLNFFIYMSVLSVAAAIVLLNVTIIELNTGNDQDVSLRVTPIPAGAFALGCAVVTGIMTLLAFVLHYVVNGWSNMFAALQGRPTDKEVDVVKYDEYLMR